VKIFFREFTIPTLVLLFFPGILFSLKEKKKILGIIPFFMGLRFSFKEFGIA
jgi:hypothetical protein